MKLRDPNLYLFVFCLSSFFFTTGACSQSGDTLSPEQQVLSVLTKSLKAKDTGAIMEIVDRSYHDEAGGPGRLEDDLRRIFSVYGKLDFQIKEKPKTKDSSLLLRYTIGGHGLEFEGPMHLQFRTTPQGPLITSGILTDMRAVLDIMRQRRLAIEHGSADMLDLIMSMDYKPEQGTRQKLLSRLHETLSSQGRVGIVVLDLKISIDKSMAKVVQSLLKLEIEKTETRENRFTEHIVLRKEGTRWRILQGLG